jgi:hypothetical protein
MKHILTLNEYRNQMEIPFLNQHPIHDKPTHIHILDRLEEMSDKLRINPTDYISDWDIRDLDNAWDNNFDEAFKKYIEYETNNEGLQYEIASAFLNEYDIIDNQEYFTDEIKNYIKENPNCKSVDIINEFNLYNYLSEFIDDKNEKLKEINHKLMRDVFENHLYEDKDVYSLIRNNLTKNGLLPIYRAIDFNKGEFIDTYTKSKEYNGVGIFWTYDIRTAEAHWGSGHQETYTLHGLIKPEYINWPNTIFKSAYSLNHEQEIETLNNVPILIVDILTSQEESMNLKKQLVVKT